MSGEATPELLESVKWTGDNLADIERFVNATCTVAGDSVLVPKLFAGDADERLCVPLHGWIVRVDGELRVLPPRTPMPAEEQTESGPSPEVERFADHLAFEGGFD